MGVVLDNRGHTDKIRGYSIPLKWHSENAGCIIRGAKFLEDLWYLTRSSTGPSFLLEVARPFSLVEGEVWGQDQKVVGTEVCWYYS